MPFNLHIDTDYDDDVDQTICNMCGNMIYGGSENLHDLNHSYMIMPFLYLGDASNAKNMTELSNLNIHTIVNMTHEAKNYYPEKFDYINFSWRDWLGFHIFDDLDDVCDQIHTKITQNRNVLVHCKMGLSRSVTVILAYLIKYKKMSFDDAYEYVKSIKSTVCPNDTFIENLITFSQMHQKIEKKC